MTSKILAFGLAALVGLGSYSLYNRYQYRKCMNDQQERYYTLLITLTAAEEHCEALEDLPQEQESCLEALQKTIDSQMAQAKAEFTKRGCAVNE